MSVELKPVRCGCGGEAWTDYIIGEPSEGVGWFVCCKNCDIQTPAEYPTEAEAIEAWNRAMSERTAKVEKVTRVSSVIRTGRCGDCGYDVIDSYKHCPNCGAKLDWSGHE